VIFKDQSQSVRPYNLSLRGGLSMDDKELFQKILEELVGIRKELKRIADYLEVTAEKSEVETIKVYAFLFVLFYLK